MRIACVSWLTGVLLFSVVSSAQVTVGPGEVIQSVLDAHPGQAIFLPAGDYEVDKSVCIATDGAGLYGFGRIVQSNPDEAILSVTNANNVRIEGIILTRAEGKKESTADGLRADACNNLLVQGVQVIDNRSPGGGVVFDSCTRSALRDCVVRNYTTVAVDDRTASPELGYAFKCLDGTGVKIRSCQNTLLEGNYIIEDHFRPTPEIQKQYDLGTIFKKSAERGELISQELWDANYYPAWHQGSGLVVNPGETTDYTQILNNRIENAAQGIDIHSDHVIVSGNIIHNAFLGMKAMHGSRNIMITNNQFSRNDLWAILLQPGASSHPAAPAEGNTPAKPPNVDGGNIIANNIISDFGYGDAYWIWKNFADDQHNCPITLMTVQMPHNTPLQDVIIQGNVVYDTGRDSIVVDGALVEEGPRYRYAVYVSTDEKAPKNVHFATNILHPGSMGVCNVEMKP